MTVTILNHEVSLEVWPSKSHGDWFISARLDVTGPSYSFSKHEMFEVKDKLTVL